MSCKCKNIIENFQGGTIPLDTTFLGNVDICNTGSTLSVSNIIGCSPITIGSDSGCTSGNTTLIVSGSSVFSCDIDVLGGIYSGGTNLIDIFSSGGGSGQYFVSDTTPTGTTENGYRWFNTSIGSEFVYIDDGDSSQWVQPLIQPGPQGPRGFSGTFVTTGVTTSTLTLTTDYTYYGVNFAGNVDLTLPDPTGIDGVNIMIKDERGGASLNRIRLIPSVGLIDGNSFVDINNNYQAYFIVARNNNWWII